MPHGNSIHQIPDDDEPPHRAVLFREEARAAGLIIGLMLVVGLIYWVFK